MHSIDPQALDILRRSVDYDDIVGICKQVVELDRIKPGSVPRDRSGYVVLHSILTRSIANL